MSRSLRQRAADRDGRALMVVLGVVALFGISSLLGFYVIGPFLMNRSAPAAQTEAQAEDSAALPEPGGRETAPRDTSDGSESLKLDVDITENGAGEPAETTEQPEKQPEATAGDAATDEGADGPLDNEKPAPTAPKRDEPEKPAQPVKENEPAVSPKPSGGSHRVQIGIYSDEAKANEVASSVRSAGIQAYVVKGVLNGRDAWRVQAGTFNEKGNAEKVVAQLKKQGIQAMVLSSEPQQP